MAKRNIYMDADSLFDTRLALLLRLDPNTAKRLAKTFDTRTSDRFADAQSTFTQEDYDKAWRLRDADLLRESITTGALRLLSQTIASINWDADLEQSERTVEVSINFWPYQLKDVEKVAICEAIELHLPLKAKVRAVFIPLQLLHLGEVKTRWDLMIAYNAFEWLEARENDLEKVDAPELLLVVPRLFRGNPETEPELSKGTNCFGVAEMLTFGKFQLRYCDVSDFSAIKP